MRPENYPPQEPLSEAGEAYAAEVARRADGRTGLEISYGDDPYQGISLHVPDNPNGTVLGFIHGGGWTSGYKEHMDFMAPAITAGGVILASIGYRLAPGHLFPAGVEDVADAIAWLYHNIAGHGGDPDRIFIGGHSAGGHYSSLLAVRDDWQAAHDIPTTVITGCLPISGVYLFGDGDGMAVRPRFLGADGNEAPASPILNIKATPPFLMAHGSEDFPHLMAQAEDMQHALSEARGEAERIVFEGRNHFTACYAGGEADGPWVKRAVNWMAGH